MIRLTLPLVLLLSGCVTSKFNSHPVVVDISFPDIGETNTVSIGENLLEQGKKTKVEVWDVGSPFKVSLVPIGHGEFVKVGEDEQYYYVRHIDAPNIPDSIRLKKGTNEVCYIGLNHMSYCGNAPKNQKIEFRDKYIVSKDTFQRSLVYNGRVGNKVNIAYREFYGDIARPAFNNNVEYDLATSKTIAYKGALIEVIEADNQTVKYKVLRNFNMAN